MCLWASTTKSIFSPSGLLLTFIFLNISSAIVCAPRVSVYGSNAASNEEMYWLEKLQGLVVKS